MGKIISFEKSKEQRQTNLIEDQMDNEALLSNLDALMDSIYERAKDINNNVLDAKVKIF